ENGNAYHDRYAGIATASYISRLLGVGNTERANRTASTALFSSIIAGVIAITVTLCFLDSILVALGAAGNTLPYARDYAVIYITGAILNINILVMNNIAIAEGKRKLNMLSMILSGGLNMVLDLMAALLVYSKVHSVRLK
ncbi:MAG: MATE family efflux transporter, partial [Anaerotignum sp.]|nr:MATE family efflux transporter [Anaerotignum sp.]